MLVLLSKHLFTNHGKAMRNIIKFETINKLVIALANNRKFLSKGGVTLYFDSNYNSEVFRATGNYKAVKVVSSSAILRNFVNKELYELVEWYEAIPEQGVLCKSKGNKKVNIVDFSVSEQDGLIFESDTGILFNKVTPLTEAEALELVYKEN